MIYYVFPENRSLNEYLCIFIWKPNKKELDIEFME